MDGEDKPDPEFATGSGWRLGAGDDAENVNHGYFFGADYKENSVLSEFGWNIPAESSGAFLDFGRIDCDLAGGSAADGCASADPSAPPPRNEDIVSIDRPVGEGSPLASALPLNPSMSSSSSEEPTASCGSASTAAANPPQSDTA